MTTKNKQIAIYLVAAFVAFNIALFAIIYSLFNNSETSTLRVMRAKEISAVASNLSKRIYDAGVALGGLTVTRSHLFSDRFDKIIVQIPHDVSDLRDLIGPDAPQPFNSLMKVAALLPDTIKAMGEQRKLIEAGKTSSEPGYRQLSVTVHTNAEQIQQSLRVIAEDIQELANAKVPERLPQSETIKILLLLGVGGNVFMGIAAAMFSKRFC